MAAASKRDLLRMTETEFENLRQAVDGLPAILRLEKDADGITPKDIIGNRAHWIDLYLGWIRNSQAGKVLVLPIAGHEWNGRKRYDADLRQRQSGLSWRSACSLLETNHAELLALIERLPNGQLYGGPMKGAKTRWSAGRWAEAAGASHYRSAAEYLRRRTSDFTRSETDIPG